METHPEIQKRAQAEIDAATGGDRLPLPDDEGSMPYLAAIIKETIRWSPVAPLGRWCPRLGSAVTDLSHPQIKGLFHSVKQDDIYEGYLIPKGTQIIANIWYVLSP